MRAAVQIGGSHGRAKEEEACLFLEDPERRRQEG
jgi:hypothetical protein